MDIEEINSIVVSREELYAIVEEGERLTAEGKNYPGDSLFLVARRYPGDWNRAFAVQTRMECLARLIQSPRSKGWVLPRMANGATPTKQAMIATAASHPLTKIDDHFSFDERSFFACVLNSAEAQGHA